MIIMNKFQVFFCDSAGHYHFANFDNLPSAVIYFRKSIILSECFLCDLRKFGSHDCIASYRNFKSLNSKGL